MGSPDTDEAADDHGDHLYMTISTVPDFTPVQILIFEVVGECLGNVGFPSFVQKLCIALGQPTDQILG